MTNGSTELRLSRLGTIVFVACFGAAAFFLYRVLAPFLSVLIWAVVLTAVFYPLFERILKIARGRRTFASFVTCALILLLIVLPVTYLGFLVTQQSIVLYEDIQKNPAALIDVTAKLHEFESRPHFQWLASQVEKWLGAGAIDLQQYLRDAASLVSKFLGGEGNLAVDGTRRHAFQFFPDFYNDVFPDEGRSAADAAHQCVQPASGRI